MKAKRPAELDDRDRQHDPDRQARRVDDLGIVREYPPGPLTDVSHLYRMGHDWIDPVDPPAPIPLAPRASTYISDLNRRSQDRWLSTMRRRQWYAVLAGALMASGAALQFAGAPWYMGLVPWVAGWVILGSLDRPTGRLWT